MKSEGLDENGGGGVAESTRKKVYIAGKITGLKDYQNKFWVAKMILERQGHLVMNPAVLPAGFDYEDYMKICFAMIDVCDAVYMLSNWRDSPGAIREYEYAKGKKIMFEGVEVMQVTDRTKDQVAAAKNLGGLRAHSRARHPEVEK